MSEARNGDADLDRVKQIFHEVLEAEPGERERLLDTLCAEDEALRARVEALLAADARATDFLESPTVDRAAGGAGATAAGDPAEAPGKWIGPYKLLQQIGEGGFGVVYMAEQETPIRRRVALKVIKPGMDTKQVIARFEAERQALAMLDHPNIAKVFDAGATPAGRPYFVMELVKGIPITDYCDQEWLGPKERLGLFAQVCGAVHHAHENGIIHRDIKPSNVMVTLHDGTPIPKVIDFGVAKAIRQKLTEATLFTEYNQFIGTPEYMAPEQAAYGGLDVDRRCDVYSLGTLLYELLTGTTPFETRKLRRAAHLEVLRILKEEDPPKPSTRVQTLGQASATAAKHRQVDPRGLARLLRGDLDWIVMKALEKDRGRRYGSAADLATDIGRYFDQRPIEARPPSFGYKARKLLRRRRGPFAAAAVVALALVGDIGYVNWQRGRMAADAGGTGVTGDRLTELLMTDEHCRFDSGRPSPDGTRILGVDYCLGGIYLHDLETGTSEMVIDGWTYWGAAWSPDGRRFVAGPGGPSDSPRIVDVETGEQHVPAGLQGLSLTPRRWSPDGDHVIGLLTGGDGNVSMELVSISSGERTLLVDGVRQGSEGSSFSPDGRHVVFTGLGEDDEDLFVQAVDTGERWVLVEGPGNDGGALWSPDGTKIVYRNDSGMWVVPVSDGRPTDRPRLVQRDAVWPAAWTEHGYYYHVSNSITRAHSLEVDPGTGRETGRRESLTLPSGDLPNLRLAWAPDMARMAVAAWTDGKIHLLRGSAVSSFSVGSEVLPSKLWWSADGREVLFTTATRAQRDRSKTTVLALDVADGTVRELFPGIEGVKPKDVSPDQERMISFQSDGSGSEENRSRRMVLSDLGATDGRVLAGPNEHGVLSNIFGQPVFSPDGSRVLFLRAPLDAAVDMVSLWVVEVDGSGERLLAEAPGTIRGPVWDPTGRMVAYVQWDEGLERSHLRVVSVDNGRSHEIDAFAEFGSAILQDWSPDGAWLGITEQIGRWELWVNHDLLGSGAQGTS